MTDPTTPAPAPLAVEGAPAAPPAAASTAPPPAAAQEPAERPRYVNPWQSRPAPVAKDPAPQAAPPAPPVASQPAAAPSEPAADPRVDALLSVLGETVAQDLAREAPGVAAAVRAIAPDSDPVGQRRALNALRASGLAAGIVAPPAPVAPPTTTINPPPSAAPPVETQEGTDSALLRQYDELVARGAHFAASNHLLTHSAAIARARSRAGVN